jgi:cell wall-associated NlpC family hydrolase
MIGKHYSYEHYNCAHFFAEWYRQKLGIEIPVTDQFELSFILWLRRHFKQIDKPVEHCLVYMKQRNLTHVGVYADNGVYHNFKPARAKGSVVHWPLGVIQRNYEKVSFWQWSE